jgi:nitrate reductase cytochrome c-type subunit
MRLGTRLSHWTLPLLALLALAGVAAGDKDLEVDDGMDVYFREEDLAALSSQPAPAYIEDEAGESQLLARAFPGAPPMISHTVVDMLPITATDNECLECHHPDNVASAEDAPLPESHFERAVMARGKKSDPMVWVVASYQKAVDVVGSRYNCVMCHTPQATNVKTPKSSFVVEKAKESK